MSTVTSFLNILILTDVCFVWKTEPWPITRLQISGKVQIRQSQGSWLSCDLNVMVCFLFVSNWSNFSSFFNLCSGVNDVVNDKRYLDLALVPNTASANQTVLILLHEKVKNKERCLTAYHISSSANGRPDISEPFSTYDKVNVLGKGVSHIAAAPFPSNTSTLKSSAARYAHWGHF